MRVRLMRAAALVGCAVALRTATAQAPDEDWRSLRTPHFAVHFPRELESLARKTAAEAERAWTRLSAHLAPPRGTIDLVLTDDQDLSNGQASYFPYNKIIIWAHPPIDNAALRFGDDWIQEVVTHELAHVFHLDRTRGIWRLGQYIFGRQSALFPQARAPRWLTEGIAIAYESKVGSGGRLNGTELYTTLDAVAGSERPLTPDRLSISSPHWPGGEVAYFGGAWLVAEALRTGGDTAMRRFIDRVAMYPIPYLWDLHAKRAFGASFTTLARRANVDGKADAAADIGATAEGRFWDVRAPRWRGDSIYFTAAGLRNVTGLFVAHGSETKRLERRNSTDAFAFGGDDIVYAQYDFVDPYRLHSALYRNGERLDGTDRLDAPDVRADGEIVAIETADGAARLVRLSAQTPRTIRRLTGATIDTQWSAARWSRRGDRIAAARWMRGGDSEIAILDSTGRELASFARARAVQTSPSWDVDDRAVYFTSDRAGRTEVYRIALTGADSGRVQQVATDVYGLHDAEISPDGRTIAAFRPTSEGFALVRVPVDPAANAQPSVLATGRRDSAVTAAGAVRRYSPLRTLIPRYWTPTLGTTSRDNILAGAYTSATDAVGRYSYTAEATWDVETGEFYGTGSFTYRGFGRPVIDLSLGQSRLITNVPQDTNTVGGEVVRRSRTAALTVTWLRPRIRQSLSVSAGGDIELRDLRITPDEFVAELDPSVLELRRFASVVLAAGWSNVSRAVLAIGPEDGLSLNASVRRRWRTDEPAATTAHSVIGSARLYKAIPLGGHTRHGIALRSAAGWAESNGTTLFSVGGVSGTSLEIVPGYSVGDSPRTFFVRGFRPGVQSGTRVWSGTAEYRAPITRIARGLWPTPLFFQRAALAVFADGGSAWCPAIEAATLTCPAGGTPQRVIASAGGELLFDTALDYDDTTRFRLGFAAPVRGGAASRAKEFSFYFSLGLPF